MQRWEQTETADTLNVYDITEARVPVLIVSSSVYTGGGRTYTGANGKGYKEDVAYTLDVVDVHGVAYEVLRKK